MTGEGGINGGRKREQRKVEKEGGRIGEESKKGGEHKKNGEKGNGEMEGGKEIIPPW